jgi:hypothetical protein
MQNFYLNFILILKIYFNKVKKKKKMLKFKNSRLLVAIFSLAGLVSARSAPVITVVKPSFKNVGGGLGFDDATIITPSIKDQVINQT